MHDLCVFCTFSTIAQEIFKGWGCNFTWCFGKVMRSKAMKMVFVARIIRHKLYMIYAFFDFLCSKIILTKNYFHTAEINLTTRGPLYTCLVLFFCSKIIFDQKLFSYCWDKFDYPGSIVYLSCLTLSFFRHFLWFSH